MPDEFRALELLSRTPYGRVSASQRALPFTTIARHVVTGGRLLLRLHRGYGYHRALDGSVVSYQADNLAGGESETWTVQFTGTARVLHPEPADRDAFGRTPALADGEPFDPVFLHIEPVFAKVHTLTDVPVFRYASSG
ncbi:pyridoxamine 5'-phosphate oxidase family protein [Streptomyces ochraceiscleroticus]|uniref:Pyridoxamine 5'-phosphate oxidase family protein n=1 Tax=Streptomyces ochraceiscleroticus TaxID=47761 RepID=A0ABW1MMT5_9ACTN|nr:pyridoxamine 5'-phosphate oxidase family protein [Streptomyces ochraceiscleroticus]